MYLQSAHKICDISPDTIAGYDFSHYVFVHTNSESYEHIRKNKVYYKPNLLRIYPPSSPFHLICASPADVFLLDESAKKLLDKYRLKKNESYYPKNAKKVSSVIDCIISELNLKEEYFEIICDTKLSELFALTARARLNKITDYTAITRTERHKLWLICEAIKKDPSCGWTVSKIASEMNFSVSRLRTIFKAFNGRIISQYIIELRIKKAMELLEKTDLSVTEIARTLDYCSTDFFSKQFFSKTGYTPTKYRNMKKGD